MATLGELKRRKAAAEFEKEHGTQEKEFPIPEIVTAVVVLIILLVFGLPKVIDAWNEHWIFEEVNEFASNLALARNTALNTKHNVIVTFEAEKGRFSMHEDTNGNGRQDSGERVEDRTLGSYIQFSTNPSFNIKDIWGQPLKNKPVDLMGSENTITFTPAGAASHVGALYLVPIKDIDKTTDHMKAIRILKTTGEIKILRYSGNPEAPWGIPIASPEPSTDEAGSETSKETQKKKKPPAPEDL